LHHFKYRKNRISFKIFGGQSDAKKGSFNCITEKAENRDKRVGKKTKARSL